MTTRFVSGGLVSHTAPLSRWWRVTFHPYVQFTRATVSVGVAHGFHGQSFNGESSGIFPLAASDLSPPLLTFPLQVALQTFEIALHLCGVLSDRCLQAGYGCPLYDGPAGAFKQKVTVSPCQKTWCCPINLILISCMGFLGDFRPKIASERAIRKTQIILMLSSSPTQMIVR
jgi:hypothetical protein